MIRPYDIDTIARLRGSKSPASIYNGAKTSEWLSPAAFDSSDRGDRFGSHEHGKDHNPLLICCGSVVKKCQFVPLFRGTCVLSWQDWLVDTE